MGKGVEHSVGGTARRAWASRQFRLGLTLVAVAAFLAAACGGAHDPASSRDAASSVAPEPLTPDVVAARLRTVEPGLTLVAEVDSRYTAGVFPSLMFRAQTAAQTVTSGGLGVALGVILIYPTPAERQAVEGYFGSESIQAPGYLVYWDGQTHSEWVSMDNVLVEVMMPGGSFGGRSPTPSELAFPESIRAALAAPPPAAAT
jgi:hypothetical protein